MLYHLVPSDSVAKFEQTSGSFLGLGAIGATLLDLAGAVGFKKRKDNK